jgi:hypothetical protein
VSLPVRTGAFRRIVRPFARRDEEGGPAFAAGSAVPKVLDDDVGDGRAALDDHRVPRVVEVPDLDPRAELFAEFGTVGGLGDDVLLALDDQ